MDRIDDMPVKGSGVNSKQLEAENKAAAKQTLAPCGSCGRTFGVRGGRWRLRTDYLYSMRIMCEQTTYTTCT